MPVFGILLDISGGEILRSEIVALLYCDWYRVVTRMCHVTRCVLVKTRHQYCNSERNVVTKDVDCTH